MNDKLFYDLKLLADVGAHVKRPMRVRVAEAAMQEIENLENTILSLGETDPRQAYLDASQGH